MAAFFSRLDFSIRSVAKPLALLGTSPSGIRHIAKFSAFKLEPHRRVWHRTANPVPRDPFHSAYASTTKPSQKDQPCPWLKDHPQHCATYDLLPKPCRQQHRDSDPADCTGRVVSGPSWRWILLRAALLKDLQVANVQTVRNKNDYRETSDETPQFKAVVLQSMGDPPTLKNHNNNNIGVPEGVSAQLLC